MEGRQHIGPEAAIEGLIDCAANYHIVEAGAVDRCPGHATHSDEIADADHSGCGVELYVIVVP